MAVVLYRMQVHPPDINVGGFCNSEEEPRISRGVKEIP
jgi:hypothetical protein